MISHQTIEGSGEEIAKNVQEHPRDRFQLLLVDGTQLPKQYGPGSKSWDEMMDVIHSMKGQTGSLPLEATSTEALYD